MKAHHRTPTSQSCCVTALPTSVRCQGFVLTSMWHGWAAAFITLLMMLSLP